MGKVAPSSIKQNDVVVVEACVIRYRPKDSAVQSESDASPGSSPAKQGKIWYPLESVSPARPPYITAPPGWSNTKFFWDTFVCTYELLSVSLLADGPEPKAPEYLGTDFELGI